MRQLGHLFALPSLLRAALAYSVLTERSLEALPSPGNDFDIHDGQLLAPILRTRVPGTTGSAEVLSHFVTFFRDKLPNWKLDFQNSTSTTPLSNGEEIPFVNLIATRDPPWAEQDGEVGRLALVAHYDSKLEPEGFIGAVDSAAPCATLLHAARSIDAALTKKWTEMAEVRKGSGFDGMEDHKGVQILLLDGEEAFSSWTSTDSLYGSRSLAEEWETTMHPAWSTYASPLASIDLFVLLDLLGAASPSVPSYFKTTHWAYKDMADVERRLREIGRFKSSPNYSLKRGQGQPREKELMFLRESAKTDSDRWLGGLIGDDHEPFLARGVEILHLIPSPFPSVWHRIDDDGEHLDLPTVEDWALLTTAFAAEWLELDGYFDIDPFSNHVRRRAEDEKTEL